MSTLGGIPSTSGPLEPRTSPCPPLLPASPPLLPRSLPAGTALASRANPTLSFAPPRGLTTTAATSTPSTATTTTTTTSDPLPPLDVSAWVAEHVTPYHGDASFLAPPTTKTATVRDKYHALLAQELSAPGQLLDVDSRTISDINAFAPGYIVDRDTEVIVGLQTEKVRLCLCLF